MKPSILPALALLISPMAYAGTPCDEVKTGIAAKLDAKGVKNYTLDAVPNDQVGDRKVVGSCEGGTMKIVYTRN